MHTQRLMHGHIHICTYMHTHCLEKTTREWGAQRSLNLPFFSVATHNSETQEHAGNYSPPKDRPGSRLQTPDSQLGMPSSLASQSTQTL